MPGTDIVERIMTQHWDLAACPCWICVEGNKAGLRPRDKHLSWRAEGWEFVGIPLRPFNPQVRPEQAKAQQEGAADNSGEVGL